MSYLKMLGLAVVASMALTAFIGAGTASADTTLEVNGVTTNAPITITASLKPSKSAILKDTFGFSSNTCKKSHVHGTTEPPYSGPTVTGTLTAGSAGLSFEECVNPVTVHTGGKLHIQYTSGTDGTVSSSGAEVTTGSPFGTLNCKTNAGTHLGTLTGKGTGGHAEMDIKANLSCSGVSSVWEATYIVTTPTGLGVST